MYISHFSKAPTKHPSVTPKSAQHLVQTLGRRHGSLDDKAANVLPALLEQGNEVVDGQHDVSNKLVLGHANVADGNTEAKNLLKLELDGGPDIGNLGGQVFTVGDGGREFTSYRTKVLVSRIPFSGLFFLSEDGENIPLDRPGPNRRGICLMRASEATKASYLCASFLMSFLFLFSFLRSSADMPSMPWCLARSRSCWSPRTL